MQRLIWIAAFVALTAWCPFASGQSAAATRPAPALKIAGQVTDSAGAAVAGARVFIVSDPTLQTTTAADGTFVLAGPDRSTPPRPTTRPAARIELTVAAAKDGRPAVCSSVAGRDASGVKLILPAQLPQLPADPSGPAPAVALYLGDRAAVVTMTFDDTHASQITKVVPLFAEYGYHATFYICAGSVGPGKRTTWDQWRAAAAAGHEIGNHALGHYLKSPQSPEIDQWNHQQIWGGYDEIARQIGRPPLTFAFPGGSQNAYTEKLVRESPHIAFRTHTHVKKNDRMYPEGDPLTAAQGIGFIDKAMAHTKAWHGAELSWFLFYMHDVTDARALVLRSMLDHIADHDDRVWCTTYAEATIYEQQREQATLKVLGRTGSSVSFTLTHDLDAKIYHRPLTVVIPAAGKVARAWAIRDGSAPPPQVKIRDQRILVDVVPAPAGVVVGWE